MSCSYRPPPKPCDGMYERRSVSILSTEGLGTMEEQERQQVHFNQQTIICLEGAAIIAVFVTVPLRQTRQWHKSVREEEGERDGRTAPRRRNPAGDKVF